MPVLAARISTRLLGAAVSIQWSRDLVGWSSLITVDRSAPDHPAILSVEDYGPFYEVFLAAPVENADATTHGFFRLATNPAP